MQHRTLRVPYEGSDLVADDMGSVIELLEYLMGDDGWVEDSLSNREVYENNKKKLMELLYNYDAWWD